MKLRQIASNMTEVYVNGHEVLFSYQTPVAVFHSEDGYVRTSKKWSPTTSRHINKWLSTRHAGNVTEAPQEFFDSLIEG
jgi:hypothetical protein